MHPRTLLEYLQTQHAEIHKHWNRGTEMEKGIQEAVQRCFEQHMAIPIHESRQLREVAYSTPHPGQGAKPTADLLTTHVRVPVHGTVRPSKEIMVLLPGPPPTLSTKLKYIEKKTFYCIEIKAESIKGRDVAHSGGWVKAQADDLDKLDTLGVNELTSNPDAAQADVARLWFLIFACGDAKSSTTYSAIKSQNLSYESCYTFSSCIGSDTKSFLFAIKETVFRKANSSFSKAASLGKTTVGPHATHNLSI